jgi:hypothetical protein
MPTCPDDREAIHVVNLVSAQKAEKAEGLEGLRSYSVLDRLWTLLTEILRNVDLGSLDPPTIELCAPSYPHDLSYSMEYFLQNTEYNTF